MLFSEPLFLFLFFPVVYVLFGLVRRQAGWRARVLLGSSVAFYSWGEPLFVPVVIVSAAADWVLARCVAAGSRAALVAAVALNLGILGYYKYSGFAVANLDA